jgi:hypothetical protein
MPLLRPSRSIVPLSRRDVTGMGNMAASGIAALAQSARSGPSGEGAMLMESSETASILMHTTSAFCGFSNNGSSASDSVQRFVGT